MQRRSLERLQSLEEFGCGMFIHFDMRTFSGDEAARTPCPASRYAPSALVIGQLLRVASKAGMKYAELIAKHMRAFACVHRATPIIMLAIQTIQPMYLASLSRPGNFGHGQAV